MKFYRYALYLVIAVTLVGGLGLVTTNNDCDPMNDEGKKMLCYHEAAITQAIVCRNDPGCANAAASICEQIPSLLGPNKQNIAESQMNYCLTDVAKHTKNEGVCDRISQDSSALDFLKGADASKEVCKTAVARLRRTDPDRYLDNATENLCALSFIFPLVLCLAFIRRK